MVKSLFNSWVIHVKQLYPDYLFQAEDEVLVDDLVIALAKGLELIWRNKSKTKQTMCDLSVDSVLIAASTALNSHWYQEYVFKHTHHYKELYFLKTIIQYLKIDAIAVKKIETLYKYMMSKERAIVEEACTKHEKIIDLNQFKKSKQTDSSFKQNMVDYLESIYFEKNFHIFGEILKNKYTIVLADFFTADEVKQLFEYVNQNFLAH
ncbi:Uncharacterised protein [Legionella beliardensis]|uniref:Uncharacterized protein n=1 Tax=Legionella beliardensis TaxID=91822 RepID=A0A378HZC1_9GAMM|nr:hypothetical protein [Legionella beliardensis]STX28279.1 Uncharacterised protein [Legionella beliardensis]